MKKLMLVVALLVAGSALFAQHHHKGVGKKKSAKKQSEMMKKKLLLTDEQYAKVKDINEDFVGKFTAIRKDTAMSQGKAQAQTKKLMDARNSQLQSVLNEPQWKKWTAMTDRRSRKKHDGDDRHHRKGRGHHDGHHG